MDTVQTVEGLLVGLPYVVMIGFAIGATLFPGIPEEVFILVIGYLVGVGAFSFLPTMLFLLVGFFLVDCALFALARRDLKILRILQEKLLGKEDDVRREFLAKHMNVIVFASRFAFYIRWIGPVVAGRLKTPWKRFMIVDAIALFFYVPFMLWLGVYFRNRIEVVLEGINTVGNIVAMVAALVVVVILLTWLRKKFIRRLRSWASGETKVYSLLGFRWKEKEIKEK